VHNNTVYKGSNLYKYFEVLVTLDSLEEKNTIKVYQLKSQETQITPLNLRITNKVHRTALFWVIMQHNNPEECSFQLLCGGSLKSHKEPRCCKSQLRFVRLQRVSAYMAAC